MRKRSFVYVCVYLARACVYVNACVRVRVRVRMYVCACAWETNDQTAGFKSNQGDGFPDGDPALKDWTPIDLLEINHE